MEILTIEHWVKNLGQPYDTLVSTGIISNQPLQELYSGRDWVDIEPEPGLELAFDAETRNFESLFITLQESMPGVPVYTGPLPFSFGRIITQAEVRTRFGDPIESKGPVTMPKPMGRTGGWDAFLLEPVHYPKVRIDFQYNASLVVDTLVFSLIDKHHN